MYRERVLLLETDSVLEGVLCDVFEDDNLDVSRCSTLAQIRALVEQFPGAAVVSDSWTPGDYQNLSAGHRSEILELGKVAHVVLTTGAGWARHIRAGELGNVEVVEKPYSIDGLLAAVHAALAHNSD